MRITFCLNIMVLVVSIFAKTSNFSIQNVSNTPSLACRMESEDESYDIEDHVYGNSGLFFFSEIEEADESLCWFFSILRSFILEWQFKISLFEQSMEKLAKDFVDIQSLVERLNLENTSFIRKFKFAKYMFECMVAAVENTKPYNYWGETAHFLVISIIELNIGILRLFDDYGEADWLKRWYESKVASSAKNLLIWTKEFDRLVEVPEATRNLFLAERIKAENTIQILKRWTQSF